MSNFVFLNPLWLLALFPLAAILLWLTLRSKQQTLIAPHLAKALGITNNKRQSTALSLISFCWLLAVVALAGPSFQTEARPSYSNSNARVLVMDMSMSMYATDIKPNRLTQSRYKALDLLAHWKEGSTGLVAYAGDAFTVSPLTSDSATINNLLPNLSPDIMPYLGSDAARGIQLAIEMMTHAGLAQGDIVLLTDDIDSQEQDEIEKLLAGTNWKLIIMGIGTQAGAPIVLTDGSMLKNDAGQTVVAKTNFANMQSLSQSVQGIFTPIRLDNSDIDIIVRLTQAENPNVGAQNKQTVEDRVNNGYWLLLLLIIPCLLLFRRGFIFSLVILFLPMLQSPNAEASPWLNQNQQAKQAFDNDDYQGASEQFTDLEWKGIAQYQAGDYAAAVKTLSQLPNTNVRSQYNLANAYAQNGELVEAKKRYEQVLRQQPDHADAQHNLDVVTKALQQQQQQQQQQQSESQSNKDQQQNSQQNQNSEQDSSSQPSDSNNADNQPSQSQNSKGQSEEQQTAQDNQQQSAEQSPADSKPNTEAQKSEPSQHESEQENADNSQSVDATQTQNASSDAEKEQQSVAAQAMEADSSQTIDPELRKLEQVESARDPSRLLKAQMFLQAKQREESQVQPPQNNGKKW